MMLISAGVFLVLAQVKPLLDRKDLATAMARVYYEALYPAYFPFQDREMEVRRIDDEFWYARQNYIGKEGVESQDLGILFSAEDGRIVRYSINGLPMARKEIAARRARLNHQPPTKRLTATALGGNFELIPEQRAVGAADEWPIQTEWRPKSASFVVGREWIDVPTGWLREFEDASYVRLSQNAAGFEAKVVCNDGWQTSVVKLKQSDDNKLTLSRTTTTTVKRKPLDPKPDR